MLQQILRDMWVEPEILAELDETQKQTLFCKMREEQVRRWHQWDQKVSAGADAERPKKPAKKQVQFMTGEDGEPWVWVMGDHPGDQSIEAMLAEEARQKALQQAREEAHQLRKSVEKELTHLIDYKPLDSFEQKFELSPKSVESLEDTLDMYCTVDELRQRIEALEPELRGPDGKGAGDQDYQNEKNLKMELNTNTLHFNFIEGKRDSYQELGLPGGGGDGVGHRVAAWERRVAAARAGDILRGLRARRARTLRDAQLHASDGDAAWREQERKAKEAEAAMRKIVRAAREEHRRSSALPPPGPPGPPPGPAPGPPSGPAPGPALALGLGLADAPAAGAGASREAVAEWFRAHELPRGAGLDERGKPAAWFHGLISRVESEQLLAASGGSFLVRLSERARGYAVSCRERPGARPRHYLVESAGAGYRLLGAATRTHDSLVDLIKYHKSVPITESGGELLTSPCVPAQTPAILSQPS